MVFQDPLMQFALDTPRHELEFTLENCQVPTDKIPERVKEALQFGKVDDLANPLPILTKKTGNLSLNN